MKISGIVRRCGECGTDFPVWSVSSCSVCDWRDEKKELRARCEAAERDVQELKRQNIGKDKRISSVQVELAATREKLAEVRVERALAEKHDAFKAELLAGYEKQLGIDPLSGDNTIGATIEELQWKLAAAEKELAQRHDSWRVKTRVDGSIAVCSGCHGAAPCLWRKYVPKEQL
jgi:hypothetical protein